jgi:uncharacterized protein YbbK (DUF523 family)
VVYPDGKAQVEYNKSKKKKKKKKEKKTGPLCPSFSARLQEPRSLSKVPDGPHS